MLEFKKGGWVEQIITFKTRFTDNWKWRLNDPEDGCEVLKKLGLYPFFAIGVGVIIAAIPVGMFQLYALKFLGGALFPGSIIGQIYCTLSTLLAIVLLAGGAFCIAAFCVLSIIYCLFELLPNYFGDRIKEKENLNKAISKLKENTEEYYRSFKYKYCPRVKWK